MNQTPVALAIHAIIEDAEAVPRRHGPIFLGMFLEEFLSISKGVEVVPAIGQFQDEQRFQLDPHHFSSDVENVTCDFFKGTLFRIEIDYRKKPAAFLHNLIEEWSDIYGKPRSNALPGTHLVFWDDGATRMILQVEESMESTVYSVTYIDDDLLHRISRERVQRETAGRANYGK